MAALPSHYGLHAMVLHRDDRAGWKKINIDENMFSYPLFIENILLFSFKNINIIKKMIKYFLGAF
jgi:hypothetical protein